jgi:C_GCAxxG_C_C family probable redox protein
MSRIEKAREKFLNGYNCAQSVLYAFCEDLNLDPETALKLACGFGAGMGRKQEVCGAVSGGVIVLGAKYGRGAHDGKNATDATYQKVRELMDRFTERHGSYVCGRLIAGCDLMTDEGQKQFKKRDLLRTVCTPCVHSVVEILEEIL